MRNFLISVTVFLAPIIAVGAYGIFTLWHFNEFVTRDEFLAIHRNGTPYLLGKQYIPWQEDHKKIVLAEEQPDSVVLGNSRSMQVRKEFFKNTFSFFNYTQIGRFADLHTYTEKIAQEEIPPPKLIIFIIDQWWFLGGIESSGQVVGDGEGATEWLVVMSELTKDILTGKIPLTAFWGGETRALAIGARAGTLHTGFRNDGSIDYGDIIRGYEDPRHEDYRFRYTLRLLERNLKHFRQGSDPDPDELKHLEVFYRDAERLGIHVVTLFAPFAPTLYNEMQRPGYDFSYRVKAAESTAALSRAHQHSFYDFTDPGSLNLTDEDFFDGIHWGEVANARALLESAEHDALLETMLDSEAILERLQTPRQDIRYLFP